jgi:hypothetical protein
MKMFYGLWLSVSMLVLLLAWQVGTVSVQASSSSTVTATVTLENVSVSVDDGEIEYGIMSLNSSRGTISTQLNDGQVATNNGNITADLNIRGEHSANWTLASSSGSNQYSHHFCTSSCDSPPTSYTALTTNYQTLSASLEPTNTQNFHLYLTTPTSSTSFTEQQVNVVVQAIAS